MPSRDQATPPHEIVVELVGELVAGGEVADAQRVVLVAVDVGRPGQQAVVGRHVERAEVEELVAVGLDVLVEQQLVGGVARGAAAAVDRVGLALSVVGVTYHQPSGRHRHRRVGLLDPRLDLLEQRRRWLASWLGEPGGGVRVLGLEVAQRVGVVAVAQPGVRVVDVAGRAGARCAVGAGRRAGSGALPGLIEVGGMTALASITAESM